MDKETIIKLIEKDLRPFVDKPINVEEIAETVNLSVHKLMKKILDHDVCVEVVPDPKDTNKMNITIRSAFRLRREYIVEVPE